MKTLTETLPAWFATTSIGQKMTQEAVEDAKAARVAHVRELAAVRKRQERELPPLTEKFAAKADVVKEAQAALKVAEGAAWAAHSARLSLSLALEREVDQHVYALLETAPEEIDTFIEELQSERAALQRDPPFGRQEAYNLDGPVTTHTNQPSVYRRVEGFVGAIRAAEELKLEVLADDALSNRLAKLRAGIPEIAMEPVR